MTLGSTRGRWVWGIVSAAVACAIVLIAAHELLFKALTSKIAGSATGTLVSIGSEHVGLHHATLTGVVLTSPRGEPVATIARIELDYNIPDALPGGHRLFGLERFAIVDPQLTLIRRADGSFNVSLPHAAGGGGLSAPLIARGRVTGGTLTAIDEAPFERGLRLRVTGIHGAFDVNTAAASRYSAGLIFHDSGRSYPIVGSGNLDAPDGYAVQHWRVPAMPVAALLNFAISNPNVHVSSGRISGVDARIFALPDARGALHTSVLGSTLVDDVDLTSPSLAQPIRGVRGHLVLSAEGAFTNDASASVAGSPVQVRGGVFDLSHPHVRLTLDGRGDLAQLRRTVVQTARLPLRGTIVVRAVAEGPVSAPLIVASVHSPEVVYLHSPIERIDGTIAVANGAIDVLDGSARYASFSGDARGRMSMTRERNAIDVLAHVRAPAGSVPYAADLVPAMPLDGTLLATASDPHAIDTRGIVSGSAPGERLDASFSVDGAGRGAIGPLLMSGDRGTLYALGFVDHPRSAGAAYVDARNVRISHVDVAPLPGFVVPALPPVDVTIGGAFAGAMHGGRVQAMGAGRVTGSLAVLDAFVPAANARGSVDAPLAFLARGDRALVQVERAQFHDASAFGARLQHADATVAVSPDAIRVLAADAGIAGTDALARGVSANAIALSARDVPLYGGAVSAGAFLQTAIARPGVQAALLARGLRYDAIPLSGIANVQYDGGTAKIGDATLGVGSSYIALDGTVAPAKLDLHLSARAADASSLLALAQPHLAPLVQGSIDTDLHVEGTLAAPSAHGPFTVPEGSVDGLGFRDLSGTIAGTRSSVSIDRGTVAIGATHVAFDARASLPRTIALSIDAPHADLSDFDDAFATGDALGGTGAIAATVDYAPGAIATNGRAHVQALRYQRIDLGAAQAQWSTSAGNIALTASASGSDGQFTARGTVNAATYATNASLRVRGANLSRWLPALGLSAPVTGTLDGDATIAGRYPDVDASLRARLRGGSIQRLTVDRASLAMHLTRGIGYVDAANLSFAHLAVQAHGTFGLHPNDPLALQATASTANIGPLLADVTGTTNPYSGALTTTAELRGTQRAPAIDDTTQLTAFSNGTLTVPRMVASIAAARNAVDVTRAEIDLEAGRVLARAHVPVRVSPAGVPGNAAFNAAFTADDVELSDFASMLPRGTHIGGRLDGTVTASGQVDMPEFSGLLTLANASYSGPQLTSTLTGGAQVLFSGETAQLQHALVHAGSGTIAAVGTVVVPSVRQIRDAAIAADVTASDATLDAPAYFKGRLDGTLGVTRSGSSPIELSGAITASSARVPLTAFLGGSSTGTQAGPALPVAFDRFTVTSGSDVRVQSPNVDIGAQGSLTLNGTLADLSPSGSFTSTGGTISFYRTFTVERGTVSFSPDSGIIPDVNAAARTFITDPYTTIQLHVTGPATDLNLNLASDPSYDRSQILGLLVGAQAFGAVQGVAATGSGNFSATGEAESLAAGQLNTVFTRSLLEPLSTALAGTLGVTNVQLTSDIAQGEYGASVVKAFGRDLRAEFSESFGFPQRTNVALIATPNATTDIRANFYTQRDLTLFPLTQPPAIAPGQAGAAVLTQLQPATGTNGFTLRYERKYW